MILHSVNLIFDTRTRTSNIGVRLDAQAKYTTQETDYPQVCNRVKKGEPSGRHD